MINFIRILLQFDILKHILWEFSSVLEYQEKFQKSWHIFKNIYSSELFFIYLFNNYLNLNVSFKFN